MQTQEGSRIRHPQNTVESGLAMVIQENAFIWDADFDFTAPIS